MEKGKIFSFTFQETCNTRRDWWVSAFSITSITSPKDCGREECAVEYVLLEVEYTDSSWEEGRMLVKWQILGGPTGKIEEDPFYIFHF